MYYLILFSNTLGQRYDFILETNQAVDNYWFKAHGLIHCEKDLSNVYAVLRYQGAPPSEPDGDKDEDRRGMVKSWVIWLLSLYYYYY